MLHSDNSYPCLRDNNSVCMFFKENNKTHTKQIIIMSQTSTFFTSDLLGSYNSKVNKSSLLYYPTQYFDQLSNNSTYSKFAGFKLGFSCNANSPYQAG